MQVVRGRGVITGLHGACLGAARSVMEPEEYAVTEGAD